MNTFFFNAGFLVVCYFAFVLCMFVDWLVLFQNPIFQNVSNLINTRSKKDILRPFHRDVLQLKIRWHTVYCVCYWRLFAQVGTYQSPGLHEWAIIVLIIHRHWKLETNTKTALPAHVSRSPDWHWLPFLSFSLPLLINTQQILPTQSTVCAGAFARIGHTWTRSETTTRRALTVAAPEWILSPKYTHKLKR